MLYSRKSIYSTAIIAFTILAYFSIGLFPKLYRKYSLYSLLNSQNCDIDYIKSIPDNFSVIAGHIYGSPFSKNDFINKKIESFLVRYKNNINNVERNNLGYQYISNIINITLIILKSLQLLIK